MKEERWVITIASDEPSTNHLVISPLLIFRTDDEDKGKAAVLSPPLPKDGAVEIPAELPTWAMMNDNDDDDEVKGKCLLKWRWWPQ